MAIAGSPGRRVWPADQVTTRPLGDGPAAGQATVTTSGFATAAPAAPGWPVVPAARSLRTNPRRQRPPGRSPRIETASAPVESPINPPVAERVTAPAATASTFAQGLPAGEHPYMVDSRRFALEYEVESVGPSGISKIEIWGTRDAGRTWASYGIEPGRQGPVRMNVEGEGLYGFRITVQDGNGFGGRPPRSGDLPELWVGVDLTKPTVQLVSAQLAAGARAARTAANWPFTGKPATQCSPRDR